MSPALARAEDTSRSLPPSATFGELVKAAGSLAAAGQGASSAGCLLRPAKAPGARLEAMLAPGMPDLPDAPEDLDALLQSSSDAALITAGARTGSVDAGLQLVALTPVPNTALQAGLLPVLIRTDRGTWFSAVAPRDMFSGGGTPAQLLDAATAGQFKKGILPRAGSVVVAAERGTSLVAFIEMLRMLDGYKGAVILATALPTGTKVPERPEIGTNRDSSSRREEGPDFCTGDTLAIPPGGKHGQLPDRETLRALDALQAEVAKSCGAISQASGGGIFKVATRIGQKGRADAACIERDPSNDPKLRACIVAVLKKFQFPKPTGGNFVNFGTSVSVSPPGSAQRALCGP